MTEEELYKLPEWNEFVYASELDPLLDTTGELGPAKALYDHWKSLYHLISAFTESLPDNVSGEIIGSEIMINAAEVGLRMTSALGAVPYYFKMERATVMRFSCGRILEMLEVAEKECAADKEYQQIIREGIAEYRVLFRQWLATFKKGDDVDEWGMF